MKEFLISFGGQPMVAQGLSVDRGGRSHAAAGVQQDGGAALPAPAAATGSVPPGMATGSKPQFVYAYMRRLGRSSRGGYGRGGHGSCG